MKTCLEAMKVSRRTTDVLIFCFIVAQPLHDGHDNPFTLVFALNYFVSYAFLWVLLLFCVQVDTDIGLVYGSRKLLFTVIA